MQRLVRHHRASHLAIRAWQSWLAQPWAVFENFDDFIGVVQEDTELCVSALPNAQSDTEHVPWRDGDLVIELVEERLI